MVEAGPARDVAARVRAFVSSNFYVDEAALEEDTSLLDRGIVDSTGVLEVVAFLGREFGVEVADEDLVAENLDSIKRIAAYVARKKSA
jgi:acyl carrier protein